MNTSTNTSTTVPVRPYPKPQRQKAKVPVRRFRQGARRSKGSDATRALADFRRFTQAPDLTPEERQWCDWMVARLERLQGQTLRQAH